MERQLLLSGMLRLEEMRGYQVGQLINAHLEPSIQFKKPTMYKLLNKMVDQDWMAFRQQQEGNCPVRRVYAMTPAGEALPLLRQRRESISQYLETAQVHNPELGDHQGGYHLLLLHQLHHLSAEIAWMDELIDHLQGAAAKKAS